MIRHGEPRDATAGSDGEAPECCRCGVVGMAFEGGADAEEVVDGEGGIGEGVEGAQKAEADGDGASEAAGGGNLAFDGPLDVESGAGGFLEKSGDCLFGHRLGGDGAFEEVAGGER